MQNGIILDNWILIILINNNINYELGTNWMLINSTFYTENPSIVTIFLIGGQMSIWSTNVNLKSDLTVHIKTKHKRFTIYSSVNC